MAVPVEIKSPLDEEGAILTSPRDFYHEVSDGGVPHHNTIHKFGRAVVGNGAFSPIAFGGVWQTPKVASATALRIKAGNTNDTATGSGAREVILIGLDQTGKLIITTLATAGTSASGNTNEKFLRLYRAFISASGTYATLTPLTGSHAANIVIENAAGSADWATIDVTGYPRGQTEIACYTVEKGFHAHIESITVFVDSAKSSDFIFLQRRNILQTTAPYSSFREVLTAVGLKGQTTLKPKTSLPGNKGGFPELTDLVFLGKVDAGTGDMVIDFEIIIEENAESDGVI